MVDTTVYQILKNEKYMGDALLQKTYTTDFLTKKRIANKGIVQQYYVEDSHPPIVPKREFAAVKAELERRSSMRGYSKTGKSNYTSEYAFSGMLFCQNCGSKLRHTFFGTGKNKRGYWLCINHQMNGNEACNARSVNEKKLEEAFVRVMNKVIGSKEIIISTRENGLTKFDEDLFRRVVEKVKVQSMVEAVFVFKTGVEVKEILG